MYHSHVKMTQLKPSTTYHYVCGDEVAGWSDEYSFTVSFSCHNRQNISADEFELRRR